MKCGRCGNEMHDGRAICPKCGVTVNPAGWSGSPRQMNKKDIYAVFGIAIVSVAAIFFVNREGNDTAFVGGGSGSRSIIIDSELIGRWRTNTGTLEFLSDGTGTLAESQHGRVPIHPHLCF